MAVDASFYLNYTTPVKAILHHIPPPKSLRRFKDITEIPTPSPPSLPFREYDFPFKLDPRSRRILWLAHKRYHIERCQRERGSHFSNDYQKDGKGDGSWGKGGHGGGARKEEPRVGSYREGPPPSFEMGLNVEASGSSVGGSRAGGQGVGGVVDVERKRKQKVQIVDPWIPGVTIPLMMEKVDSPEWDDDDLDEPGVHIPAPGIVIPGINTPLMKRIGR